MVGEKHRPKHVELIKKLINQNSCILLVINFNYIVFRALAVQRQADTKRHTTRQ